MIIKCADCGEKIEIPKEKIRLMKIGKSYKCYKCRGFKFIIEEL